jgi:hypothetical protein
LRCNAVGVARGRHGRLSRIQARDFTAPAIVDPLFPVVVELAGRLDRRSPQELRYEIAGWRRYLELKVAIASSAARPAARPASTARSI